MINFNEIITINKFLAPIFFFIIFITFSSSVHSNNCFSEVCNEEQYEEWMEDHNMIMSFSKPEYDGLISNITTPIEIEYNLPSQFKIVTKTIIPTNVSKDIDNWFENNMNWKEDGETCKDGYQKKSSGGCGSVKIIDKIERNNFFKIKAKEKNKEEINKFIEIYKEAEIKKIPIPKYEMIYEFNSNQTIWTWFGMLCELYNLFDAQLDCTSNNVLYLDYPTKTLNIKKLITKNGPEIYFQGLSVYNPKKNNWEIDISEYSGDWGKSYESLTSLTTPILSLKNTNFYKQGDKLYEYKLRYLMNYALAPGVMLDNFIYNLDGIIIGKTVYRGRDSLLIDLKTNKKSPIIGEQKNKLFEMYGYQIVDIKTGLIVNSRINIMFNHPFLDDFNQFFLILTFFEKDIFFS